MQFKGNVWMKNRNLRKWEVSAAAALAGMTLLGLAVFLTGCSRSVETSPLPSETDLVVCTDLEPAVYAPVVKEFEERTGLAVEVLADTTEGIKNRFAQERKKGSASDPAKQQEWDVAFGVSTELLESCSDLWEPYESTQETLIAEQFCASDHTWTAFSVLPLVIMYNTNVVTYRELPSGWESLLEPRWQGRVAFADPEVSDVSQTALAAAVLTSSEGETYPAALAANLNGSVLDSLTQVNEGILDGRYSVGVTTEEAAQALRSSGADIDYIYPEEGTLAVLEGTAVRAGCEHEETAKQFLDFTVGKAVQKILSVSRSRRSVRTDVAAEKGMDPFERIPFVDVDAEKISTEQGKALDVWEDAIRSGTGTGNSQTDTDSVSGKGGAS